MLFVSLWASVCLCTCECLWGEDSCSDCHYNILINTYFKVLLLKTMPIYLFSIFTHQNLHHLSQPLQHSHVVQTMRSSEGVAQLVSQLVTIQDLDYVLVSALWMCASVIGDMLVPKTIHASQWSLVPQKVRRIEWRYFNVLCHVAILNDLALSRISSDCEQYKMYLFLVTLTLEFAHMYRIFPVSTVIQCF